MSITGTSKTEERVAKLEEEKLKQEMKIPEDIQVTEKFPPVKQLIRWISKQNITNPDMQFDRVQDIDAELSTYYGQGYKLFGTHYIGQNPEAFGVLYILTK